MTTARTASAGTGVEASWLPLLQRLTAVDRRWCVWKNADTTVAGEGDVDSAAPRAAWPAITDEFCRWAADSGAGPVIACRHAPESLVLAACAPHDRAHLLQLDAYERVARVVTAESLARVAELDARGFRRLPPGAEGLLLLLASARRGGRAPSHVVQERIAALLRADPRGVEVAARLLGPWRRPALAGAQSVADGGWSQAALAALEPLYVLRAAQRPQARLRWLRFQLGRGRHCKVLAALSNNRTVHGNVEQWLAEVSADHAVYGA